MGKDGIAHGVPNKEKSPATQHSVVEQRKLAKRRQLEAAAPALLAALEEVLEATRLGAPLPYKEWEQARHVIALAKN